MHAITLLAQDRAAERAWYWNGFGLTVVDAIRPIRSYWNRCLEIRLSFAKATLAMQPLTKLTPSIEKNILVRPCQRLPGHGKDAAKMPRSYSAPKTAPGWQKTRASWLALCVLKATTTTVRQFLKQTMGVIITGAYIRRKSRQAGSRGLVRCSSPRLSAQGTLLRR